jgi:hypothetical protein
LNVEHGPGKGPPKRLTVALLVACARRWAAELLRLALAAICKRDSDAGEQGWVSQASK